MSGIVLGCRKTRITARNLANALEAEYAENYVNPNDTYKFAFRYGNSQANLPSNRPCVIINTARSIEIAANKPRCRKILRENEIPVPTTWSSDYTLNHIDLVHRNWSKPLIARPRYHFQGRNFKFAKTLSQAQEFLNCNYYLQEIIEKLEEYRVFIFNGKFFEVNKKVPTDAVKSDIIRNYGNGWFFQWMPYDTAPKTMLAYCKKAANAIELEWSAIDCCIDTAGNAYIFEINSAPALISRKCQKLAEKIQDHVNNLWPQMRGESLTLNNVENFVNTHSQLNGRSRPRNTIHIDEFFNDTTPPDTTPPQYHMPPPFIRITDEELARMRREIRSTYTTRWQR